MTAVRVETIGDATLYLGDCLDVLPDIGEVSHVLSDPPYDDASTHKSHLSTTKLRNGEPARQSLGFDGFALEDTVSAARQWCEIASGWVVFSCDWKHMHALHEDGTLVRFGIWRKRNGAPQLTGDRPGMGWEPIAICHGRGRGRGGDNRKTWNSGGKHAFWDVLRESGTEHPTQKPVLLYEQLLADFTNRGDLVLDPYMGSGTAGVACANTGRRFVGVEKEPRWFDVACKRIDAAARQGRLFA